MTLPSSGSGFGSQSITLAGAYNYDLPKQTNNYAPPTTFGQPSDDVIKPSNRPWGTTTGSNSTSKDSNSQATSAYKPLGNESSASSVKTQAPQIEKSYEPRKDELKIKATGSWGAKTTDTKLKEEIITKSS